MCILILFSIYNHDSVEKCMVLINCWFQKLLTSERLFPTTFDKNFFLKGMFLVMDGDHALSIAKSLWVLYNNYPIFNSNHCYSL